MSLTIFKMRNIIFNVQLCRTRISMFCNDARHIDDSVKHMMMTSESETFLIALRDFSGKNYFTGFLGLILITLM